MANDLPDVQKLERISSSLPPYPHSWHGMCFGCSQRNPHGLLMDFWPLEGGAFSKYQIPAHFCGFDGVVHGGIVASVLDEVSAWAINTSLLGVVLTRKMAIAYLKPVPTQTDLYVVSLITHVDERNVTAYSTILNTAGARLAEAKGEFSRASIGLVSKIANVPETELQKLFDQMVTPIKEYKERIKKS